MEYIKKEELIEGEIYYVSTTYGFWMIGLVTKSNNGDNSNCDFRGNATFINKRLEFNKDQSWCYKGNHRTYRLATPEEKHWLNCCITADKFITFEQFKKYVLKEEIVEEKVIEPLPQFKIIETIETITKVENNEGNQFFINDKIKVSLNMVQKIISFSYNEDKTEIFANFNQNLSISINDIEHYIEPKVEETLLEKAKIIEHSHDFKIGDKIKLKLDNGEFNFVFKIIKIEGNVLFFGNSIHSRVLAKNVIKVN